MPNADHFRAASNRFRARGELYRRQAALIGSWRIESHLDAGTAVAPLADRLARARQRLIDASGVMESLSTVCVRRAEICADYRHEYDRWANRPAWERAVNRPPTPPYPWVSR